MSARYNVDKPIYDQSTFIGRFRHFAWVTDPRTVILPSERLMEAKTLVEQYRVGKEPAGTTDDQIRYAMKLYQGGFHPDTGELQNVFGRMSFQVPGGMIITGAMLAWYQRLPTVIFWQFVNQSFNAVVNYTNRNANSPTTVNQLGVAYLTATTSACATAIGLKNYLTTRAAPVFQRFVPFAAVAAANCVNIPLMRQNEIRNGIEVQDENGNVVGRSRVAAVKGISQVVFSRIFMATPGMLILPVIMERVEKFRFYKRVSWANAPFQTAMVGCFLLFMVPTACGLFPQKCTLSTKVMHLMEPELYREMESITKGKVPARVYFNKGL